MNNLLKDITILLKQYYSLDIEQAIDWEKYNHYSIVHHSTTIEGASLTEEETQLLLEENITAKGKPFEHHNMQLDHYQALQFVLENAKLKNPVTSQFIKEIGGKVMSTTGGEHKTILGTYNSNKGDFRLQNVHAGNTRFVDFTKVSGMVEKFCEELNENLKTNKSRENALITSFDAHFNLVSIHPFRDGNGRVSRLIMNFVQHYHNLPLSNVFKEDKAEYYKALVDSRVTKDINIFRVFMLDQYKKMLIIEINKTLGSQNEHEIKKPNKKGFGMSMFF